MDNKEIIQNCKINNHSTLNFPNISSILNNKHLNKSSNISIAQKTRRFGNNISNTSLTAICTKKKQQSQNDFTLNKKQKVRERSRDNNVKIPKKIFNIQNNLKSRFGPKETQKNKNSKISEKIEKNEKIELPVTEFDLHYVKEYQEEIFEYLISMENKILINPNYFSYQNDISEKMREILVDWLFEVHLKFKLIPETLFLTISLIDRYLQITPINRKYLQLVGIASLLIACKYEEIYPPENKTFVYITDNAYNIEQLLNMENQILRTLSFDLTYPSILRYMEIICVKFNYLSENDKLIILKMMYLLELSLFKINFYKYSKIELVIACCLLANKEFVEINKDIFIVKCIKKLNVELDENKINNIKKCSEDLSILAQGVYENKINFKAIQKKYNLEKNMGISESKFW